MLTKTDFGGDLGWGKDACRTNNGHCRDGGNQKYDLLVVGGSNSSSVMIYKYPHLSAVARTPVLTGSSIQGMLKYIKEGQIECGRAYET